MTHNAFDIMVRAIELKSNGKLAKVVTYDSDAEKDMHINTMTSTGAYIIEDYQDSKTLIFLNP